MMSSISAILCFCQDYNSSHLSKCGSQGWFRRNPKFGIMPHQVLWACCHYVLSCSVVRHFVTARCKLFTFYVERKETPRNYDWDVFEVVNRLHGQICHPNYPLIGQLTLLQALSLVLNCKLYSAHCVSSSLVPKIAVITKEDAWWKIWEIT